MRNRLFFRRNLFFLSKYPHFSRENIVHLRELWRALMIKNDTSMERKALIYRHMLRIASSGISHLCALIFAPMKCFVGWNDEIFLPRWGEAGGELYKFVVDNGARRYGWWCLYYGARCNSSGKPSRSYIELYGEEMGQNEIGRQRYIKTEACQKKTRRRESKNGTLLTKGVFRYSVFSKLKKKNCYETIRAKAL